MPFNGSGVFLRVRNWVNDATAGIKIRADFHDSEDDNIAQGLSQCITKDGQTTVTANLPMATYRHTNVGEATQLTQYARYDQVSGGQANWAIAGGTGNAITASFPVPLGTITDGQEINIRLTNSNTGTSITLAADGGSAFPIVKANGDNFEDGEFYAGREVTLRYRGADTSWVMVDTQRASDVSYNNTGSGLSATNVQDAIDEAVSDFSDFEGRVDGFATAAQGAKADTALQPTGSGVGLSGLLKFVQGSSKEASGVFVDFTGVPANTKKFTIMFDSVSLSGNSAFWIQLKGSSTPETFGYQAVSVFNAAATSSAIGSTGGFVLQSASAPRKLNGAVTFTLMDATTNTWAVSGSGFSYNDGAGPIGGVETFGTKSLASALTGFRVTSVNGTDSLDNGTIRWVAEVQS